MTQRSGGKGSELRLTGHWAPAIPLRLSPTSAPISSVSKLGSAAFTAAAAVTAAVRGRLVTEQGSV